MIGNFLGYFEKTHSYVKTALATFWATLEKNIGLLFSPTSGHSVYDVCTMLAVFGSFLLFTKAKQQQQSSIAKVEKFFFWGGEI